MVGCWKDMTVNVATGRECSPTMSAVVAFVSSQLGLELLGVGLIVPTAAG
jgi:hypothetical protein